MDEQRGDDWLPFQADVDDGVGEGFPCWTGRSLSGKTWKICCGPALDVLDTMPAASVNCIVTSPPYFWLRDYRVEGQLGLESTIDDYVEGLSDILRQGRRVLADDGLLFLNIGDTFYSGKGKSHGEDKKSTKRRFGLRAVDKSGGLGINLQRKSMIGIPWRVAMRLAAEDWVLRSAIVWHRRSSLPEHVRDRPSRSYEYVFMLAKSRYYYFNKQPLIDKQFGEDMWSIPAKPRARSGIDTAPFPDELVRRCLEIGCKPGGMVLDPFLGSGTTTRVAMEMGMSAVGVELSPNFCKYAVAQMGG